MQVLGSFDIQQKSKKENRLKEEIKERDGERCHKHNNKDICSQTSFPDNCVVSVSHSISRRGLSAYTIQVLGVRLRVFIAFIKASCIVTPCLIGTYKGRREEKEREESFNRKITILQ